ncbi:MAG TPA: hypothetical protein PKD64_10725 [Pirellulaceae bacterium]|nr:hypothetical protein [Pirellulaceae bacterium]HMO92655.1 hypothetical protein [Pirellulaceae bacterium]HMP70197.1 hypothetical protein [Pirellulaceae bacterium]
MRFRTIVPMRVVLITWVAAYCSWFCAGTGLADERHQPISIKHLNLGVAKQIVIGHWVPIHIEFDRPLSSDVNFVEVSVPDGNGMQHHYRLPVAESQPSLVSGLIRIGRENAEIVVKLLNKDGQSIQQLIYDNSSVVESHTYHPPLRPIHLNFGTDLQVNKNLGLDRIASKRDEDIFCVHETDTKFLPDTALGYDSIEKIILTTLNQDSSFLEDLSESQIDAIYDWVASGGKMSISCGVHAKKYFGAGGRFERFAISPVAGTMDIQNTGRIESYLGSRDPLIRRTEPPIIAAQFSAEEGIVVLADRNGPMISKKAIGFGMVTFLSIDLDEPRVLTWPDFPRLLSICLGHEFVGDQRGGRSEASSGRVTHIGFEDISGQLRAALDQFRDVRQINFTVVAVLIGIFLLMIGPADYFLLRKLLKRMELTWITFPLIVAGFCGLAYWLHSISRPSEIKVNQIEIIDIDETTKLMRGTIWAHVYSPTDSKTQLELASNPMVAFVDSHWLSWAGLPGTGLGGMQNQTTLRGAGYHVDSSHALTDGLTSTQAVDPGWFGYRAASEGTSREDRRLSIRDFPFQSAATAAFTGKWFGTTTRQSNSSLTQNRNRSDLTGTITNPLDFELDNIFVIHNETVYRARAALRPGATMRIETDARDKRSLRDFFKSQRGERGEETKRNWEIYSLVTPDIVEMMMFFAAADGQFFTKLTNQYVADVDLSHLIQFDRAILVGRAKRVTTPLQIHAGLDPQNSLDQQWTFVRMVLPVTTR